MTGPVGAVLVAQQRRGDAVRVAAVAQLAEELVDQVAAVGEDQHAARARGLDEAERRDGLAGAGRVLEPEAPRRARVLGLLGKLLVLERRPARSAQLLPSAGPRPRRSSSSSSSSPRPRARRPRPRVLAPRRLLVLGSSSTALGERAPLPFWRSASAISAVSVPDRASTWWADSTAPSASLGSSSASSRSRPSISENSRRHSIVGSSRPASISASAASNARRRAVPGRSASGSCANGSRVHSSTRSSSSREGTGAAFSATSVVLAISRLAWINRTPSHGRRRLQRSSLLAVAAMLRSDGSLRGPGGHGRSTGQTCDPPERGTEY